MKNIRIANFIAFIIGIYLIIRAFFLYTKTEGNIEENKFFGISFFCVGILCIIIQLIINYIREKKGKK